MAKPKKPKNGRRTTSLAALKQLVALGVQQDNILRELRDSYGSAIPEISGILQALSTHARDNEMDLLRRLIVEYHGTLDEE